MNDALCVLAFLISVGMLMAATFIGVGVCIGRAYEKLDKRQRNIDHNVRICGDTDHQLDTGDHNNDTMDRGQA